MTDNLAIELEGVEIRKNENIILQNVNMAVGRGEFVYLTGRVGSGKSSLVKSLICEFPISVGNARVLEYNLRNINRRDIPYLRRRVGVVFQDFNLLMERTVYDNLEFVLKATGWRESGKIKVRVKEVLQAVGMEHKLHVAAHRLSGGEQQRVAIARALLNTPSVIFADEPTGNLDADTRQEIMQQFINIHKTDHPAIVMITHNTEFPQIYPGRVFRCESGSLFEMAQ